jgi:hypothetical protein
MSFATYLTITFPARTTPVKVGSFDGALTWADPDANGVRTHNLYWSDGKFNYSLIVNRSADATLALGRGLVCG